MKKCKYCKSEIDEKAKICPHCNKKQSIGLLRCFAIAIGIILIAAGITGVGTGTKSDKKSDDDACYMTLEKFNKIEQKMSYEEVVEIVGCEGTLDTESSAGDQEMKIYHWYAENGISNATMSFHNNVLNAKSQIGLK